MIYVSIVLAIIAAGLLSVIVAFLIYAKQSNVKLKFNVNRYILGTSYLFMFGLPLIFHQLNFFLKGQADRLFIYNYFDSDVLGVYAAAFQIASVYTVLLHSVNKAVVPYFYENLII